MKVRMLISCLVAVVMLSADSLLAQVVPGSPLQTGSVSGVIRTATGAPATGIRVTAMRTDAMDDALRAMVSLTQSDSSGRYHLENVPAGRYYIAAGRVDLPTYYPGTLNMTQGTTVSISSATALAGIDFVIQDTSAAVPPARRAFSFSVGRTFNQAAPAAPAPLNRGRGQVWTPNTPQPAPPLNSWVTPFLQRYTVGRDLVAVAAQPNAAWWTNAALVARLGLTADQMKKVEATFDQYRQAIVQNTTELAKEEAALSRLLEVDTLEPAKTVTAQIDRVIQARGELERTNSKMTLEMRQSLTRAQWVQLQMETQQPAPSASQQLRLRSIRPNPPATR